MKIFQTISQTLQARNNCLTKNPEWFDRHHDRIMAIVRNGPNGSGFDVGTQLDFTTSQPDRLVFTTEYHHLHENGYYTGWTSHTVVVTPSLSSGFNLKVTGKDRNQIKDYIGETFHQWLNQENETEIVS